MADDAFDGFGALACSVCGTSLDLRWTRSQLTFTCAECGATGTVARETPRRARPKRSVRRTAGAAPTGEAPRTGIAPVV